MADLPAPTRPSYHRWPFFLSLLYLPEVCSPRRSTHSPRLHCCRKLPVSLGPSRTPSSVFLYRAPLAAIASALPPPGPSSRESHTVTANYLTGSPILKILGWSGRRAPKTTVASPNSNITQLVVYQPLTPLASCKTKSQLFCPNLTPHS